MKRSEINEAFESASACFAAHNWALPPHPRWDVTDFGLGRFKETGLILVNLAEEPEYCEKLMFAYKNQVTPLHTHRIKKEDIICRSGMLVLELWNGLPAESEISAPFSVQINGSLQTVSNGEPVTLNPGERITLTPGIFHAFWPATDDCIIGEVSTANNDVEDNIFVDPEIGRFPEIEEDAPAKVILISE